MAAALFWVGWPVSSDRVLGTMGPGCSNSNNSDIPKKKALCTFYVHSTILKISTPAAGRHLGFFLASLEKNRPGGLDFFFPGSKRGIAKQKEGGDASPQNNSVSIICTGDRVVSTFSGRSLKRRAS